MRVIESRELTGRICQKSCLRWRRGSESIPGDSALEALFLTDRAERIKFIPLDLPKYLRELGFTESVRRRFRMSVSVSLLSPESSLWLPGTLGVGKDGCKGEPSLEE